MKGVVSLEQEKRDYVKCFKEELAKELGFYDVVQKEGWGGIRARDAGNMVKLAIEKAQRQLVNKE